MPSQRVIFALASVRALADAIDQLSEEEVNEALVYESETRRRMSIMNLLISKAADFNRQNFIRHLKEKLKWQSPQ
jgi:hypothetical protein